MISPTRHYLKYEWCSVQDLLRKKKNICKLLYCLFWLLRFDISVFDLLAVFSENSIENSLRTEWYSLGEYLVLFFCDCLLVILFCLLGLKKKQTCVQKVNKKFWENIQSKFLINFFIFLNHGRKPNWYHMLLLGGISFCCQLENCKSWLLFLYIYYASGVIFISETPSIILEKHTMAKKWKL